MDEQPEDGETHSEDEGSSEAEDSIKLTLNVQPAEKSEARDEHRPKKRRKLTPAPEVAPPNAPTEIAVAAAVPEPVPDPEAVPAVASAPPASLPSFPLPVLPDAPSPSVLALQGLDPALARAEVIDPAILVPIPPEGEDHAGTGLNAITRRRLKELGITELFAGTSSVCVPVPCDTC